VAVIAEAVAPVSAIKPAKPKLQRQKVPVAPVRIVQDQPIRPVKCHRFRKAAPRSLSMWLARVSQGGRVGAVAGRIRCACDTCCAFTLLPVASSTVAGAPARQSCGYYGADCNHSANCKRVRSRLENLVPHPLTGSVLGGQSVDIQRADIVGKGCCFSQGAGCLPAQGQGQCTLQPYKAWAGGSCLSRR